MNETYENDIYTDDYLDCTHEIDYNIPIRNNQDKIRYNGKSTIDSVLLSATFIPYTSNLYVHVFDKILSDADSPICLDLIF